MEEYFSTTNKGLQQYYLQMYFTAVTSSIFLIMGAASYILTIFEESCACNTAARK